MFSRATPILHSDFRLHIPVLASLAIWISLSSKLKSWILYDLTQIPPLHSEPRSSWSALGCLYLAASSIVHISLHVKSCPSLNLLFTSLLVLNPSHRPLNPCTYTCNERLSSYNHFLRSLFKFFLSKPCKQQLDPRCMATERTIILLASPVSTIWVNICHDSLLDDNADEKDVGLNFKSPTVKPKSSRRLGCEWGPLTMVSWGAFSPIENCQLKLVTDIHQFLSLFC